jgi:aarF domain-containing kinase
MPSNATVADPDLSTSLVTTTLSNNHPPTINQPQTNHALPIRVSDNGYDPLAVEIYFQQRPVIVLQRMLQVTAAALKFLSVLSTSKLNAAIYSSSIDENIAPAFALQPLLTNLGPSFVKLAQVLSMRPDLVGEVYASALSQLQDNVAPFDNAIAMEIIQQELGVTDISSLFSYITPTPIASASLGQVYKATLASDGQQVAVKVQRPGVKDTIALDVYLLRLFIGIGQKAARLSRDLRGLADEVGRALYGECDFKLEGQNAGSFTRAHRYMPFVTVPTVFKELTTEKVLVSQWIDGIGPSALLSSQKTDPIARKQILNMVRMGIQCSLAQLLSTGVMHGDPHSGNLLLTRDGKLCYLDFGLIVGISDAHRQAMMSALIHTGLGEWRRLVDDLASLDLLKPETDKAELAADLEREFLAVLRENQQAKTGNDQVEGGKEVRKGMNTTTANTDYYSNGDSNSDNDEASTGLESQLPLLTLSTAGLSFGSLTRVLFRVAYRYKFLLPTYFPLMVRSIASLEGVALSVDPSFKIISAGMPIVLTQLLGDRRPAAQALLRELLLTPNGALRTDKTTEQIMQVWLTAAQQQAAAEALSSPSSSSGAADGGGDVDLTAILLDRRHGALRRVLLDANPAQTVSDMQDDFKEKIRAALSQAFTGDSLITPGSLFESGSHARAQRKRAMLLFKHSIPKVLSSSPKSVWQLVVFTVSVVMTLLGAKVKSFWEWVVRLFGGWRGEQWNGEGGGEV